MSAMTVGSLFAGIGGFDLAASRCGMDVRWQIEVDEFCQRVLEKHWPDVRRYGDIKHVDGVELEPVDLICGGFPCQPVSLAGKREGDNDDRWLWPEFLRLVRELRPRWVLVENVPGLRSIDAGRLFGAIQGDLAAIGYDAEWDCIPAAAVGAEHIRDRIWIVAYPYRLGQQQPARIFPEIRRWFSDGSTPDLPDTDGSRCEEQYAAAFPARPELDTGASDSATCIPSDAAGTRRCARRSLASGPARDETWRPGSQRSDREAVGTAGQVPQCGLGRGVDGLSPGMDGRGLNAWPPGWDDGIERAFVEDYPDRVKRLRGIGNAIVPQVAQLIFAQILVVENSQ